MPACRLVTFPESTFPRTQIASVNHESRKTWAQGIPENRRRWNRCAGSWRRGAERSRVGDNGRGAVHARRSTSVMASLEDGFATATIELLSGYPAYFYRPGDGDYTFAMDDKYGLPIKLAGDFNPDDEWICGFNRGVIAHIEKYGVPWNSRLASFDVLLDMSGYFRRRTPQRARLKLGGKAFQSDGFGLALTFEDGEAGYSIKIETDSLFVDTGIVPDVMMPYRSGPPPTGAPTCPQPPLLKAGCTWVWLWCFDNAQCVECVPGPPGSHLVVFRFSDFAPRPGRRTEGADFGVLDTQLARWLPGALSQPQLEPFRGW